MYVLFPNVVSSSNYPRLTAGRRRLCNFGLIKLDAAQILEVLSSKIFPKDFPKHYLL